MCKEAQVRIHSTEIVIYYSPLHKLPVSMKDPVIDSGTLESGINVLCVLNKETYFYIEYVSIPSLKLHFLTH